jgi:small redox-active disulfide protein 2
MEIKVLGRGCAKCGLTEELVRQVIREERVDAHVEKVTGYKEIAEYGVFLTPCVMIDGEVKCVGRIPGREEIKAWITKHRLSG